MIVHTPALVLKAIDFKESSRIVTLLTPEKGKIAVIVKGARKPKSKYLGFFEAGNLLDVVLFIKPTRTVQNISEVEYRHKNWSIRVDMTKLAVMMSIVELLDQLVHEHEEATEFFHTAEKMLCWLGETQDDVTMVLPYVMIRFADLSGISLQYSASNELNSLCYLNIEDGIIKEDAGIGLSFNLSPAQNEYLRVALSGKKSAVLRNSMSKNELKTLIYHLDVYFKHHIENYRDRKSDFIFDQIL